MIKTDQPNLYVHMLGEQEDPLSDKIRSTGLEGIGKGETLAAHISPSSVHNLMNTDNTLNQVSLELCNSKRGQQLQIMAAMNENSVHFGKACPGVLARKAGEVVHLLQGVSMKAWLRSDASGNCYSDIPIELKTHAGKMMNLLRAL